MVAEPILEDQPHGIPEIPVNVKASERMRAPPRPYLEPPPGSHFSATPNVSQFRVGIGWNSIRRVVADNLRQTWNSLATPKPVQHLAPTPAGSPVRKRIKDETDPTRPGGTTAMEGVEMTRVGPALLSVPGRWLIGLFSALWSS